MRRNQLIGLCSFLLLSQISLSASVFAQEVPETNKEVDIQAMKEFASHEQENALNQFDQTDEQDNQREALLKEQVKIPETITSQTIYEDIKQEQRQENEEAKDKQSESSSAVSNELSEELVETETQETTTNETEKSEIHASETETQESEQEKLETGDSLQESTDSSVSLSDSKKASEMRGEEGNAESDMSEYEKVVSMWNIDVKNGRAYISSNNFSSSGSDITDVLIPNLEYLRNFDPDRYGNCTTVEISPNALRYLPSNMTSIAITDMGDENSKVYYADTSFPFLRSRSSLKTVDLSRLEAPNIITMREMFFACRSLTSLDISNFDTSKVTDMYKMFYGCSSLPSLDVSKFDTSQVINMSSMFEECRNLTSLDVSKFDTSQVINMSSMFEECRNLTSLDVSNFNTSKVTTMAYMFSECLSLNDLDISDFDTSQVSTTERMFNRCESLRSLDVSNFDTSKITNMNGMFFGCRSLPSLDVSKFDTSQVTTMNYMFYGCRSLTSIDVSGFDTSLVTDMSSMFSECNNLSSLDVSNFNTSKVTTMYCMFSGCESLSDLDLSNFDTSQVTSMGSMFNGCESLSDLDLSNFDTSQVTSMGSMFNGCESLSDLDLSNFDTSQVTNMISMFNRCESLSDLDLSNFDTSQVTSMNSMFNRCSSLASLDIGKFDTSKVKEMNSMFEYSGISFIDLSDWKLNDSVKTTRMFYAGPTAKKNLLVIAKDPKLLNYGYGSFGYRPENILFNANGGSFLNGKTQLNYLKNVAITPEEATIDRVKEFARNNQPIRSKFMFGGWECAKQGDSLEHFTDFYSLIGKNYNAIWIPNNPNVPTGSILLPDSLNQLDLYYIPKGFIIPETELKDVEQQVIPFRDGNGFHIAIRDQQSGKRWQLKASLKWDKQGLEDSYIQSGNTSGQVHKNNNNGQDLVQPSDYEEAPEISGVPNLKIGSTETCVMESKQGQGQGVYDFALNDAALVINNAKYTQPNEYTGYVNWNLESAP